MWSMFLNSAQLFLKGKLFRDMNQVMRQGAIGVAIGVLLLVVLAKLGLPVWCAAQGWVEACQLADIPVGNILERRVKDRSVLLYREGDEVSCVDNACAHLGMPLEMGAVEGGIITCTYHGFRYLLATGECLTVPEVQLKVHAVRVKGANVEVRLEE